MRTSTAKLLFVIIADDHKLAGVALHHSPVAECCGPVTGTGAPGERVAVSVAFIAPFPPEQCCGRIRLGLSRYRATGRRALVSRALPHQASLHRAPAPHENARKAPQGARHPAAGARAVSWKSAH